MSKEGILPPYPANPITFRPASSPGYWVLGDYLEYVGDQILDRREARKTTRQAATNNLHTNPGVIGVLRQVSGVSGD